MRVIFQAGTSKVGQAFAARHAEAVYIGGLVPSQASYQIKTARDLCREAGRDPYSIKFFAAINPIIGRTIEEAQAKYDEAMQYADVIGALAQFSGYTGIDMSKYPLDEELRLDTSNPKESAVQGFLGNFGDSQDDGDIWTPRRLGEKIAVGGFHPTPVGTPVMFADVMKKVSANEPKAVSCTDTAPSGSTRRMSMASTWPTSATQALSGTLRSFLFPNCDGDAWYLKTTLCQVVHFGRICCVSRAKRGCERTTSVVNSSLWAVKRRRTAAFDV